MPDIEAKDGTKLDTVVYGEGRDVVLIHGWPLSRAMWEYQLQPLVEAGNRVIAYTRRGFGFSDQPWNGYDYDTMADDLDAVMRSTGAANAALVGFSMGGGEVARYMSRHSGRNVRSAALVSAVTPYMLKTEDNPDGADGSVFEGMKDGLRDDRPGFLKEFNKDFFGQGLVSGVSEAMLDWAVSTAMQGSAKATLDCVDAFGKTDFRTDMSAFTVPTLFVHGTGDKTVPIAVSADRAVEMIAGAEIERYDGAPHALVITHKDRFNADLIAFLKR